MDRTGMIAALEARKEPWDIIIIGGGATGLGIAVDAASRGYSTLLLERHDFAKGTSSRSTKLIHGGVRYLQQGNVGLVLEALRERGLLTQNAPHLVGHLAFIVPNYVWWEAPFYGIGLKIYDLLAGKLGLGPSKHLSREETLERLPTLEPNGLKGGTIYYDGQFDDARLAITLALTAVDHGATVLNYAPVVRLSKKGDLVRGVVFQDLESGREHEAGARVVVNATGVFADNVRRMDESASPAVVRPSQGIHVVLNKSFMPSDSAIMVPKTDDGRVLFCIPWHDRVLVGTTDTAIEEILEEPRPMEEEIEFLLTHTARYLTKDPKREDVLSAFAGLRPLVRANEAGGTASVPRDHSVLVSKSGLVTVVGGKWTTYRKMAQDAVDEAELVGGFEPRPCQTEGLHLHGWQAAKKEDGHYRVYGADQELIRALSKSNPAYNTALHGRLPYRPAEVIWAARHEMARTLEDVLSRRTRALLLDARASLEIAPQVASLLAAELGRSKDWEKKQLDSYEKLAGGYLIASR